MGEQKDEVVRESKFKEEDCSQFLNWSWASVEVRVEAVMCGVHVLCARSIPGQAYHHATDRGTKSG